MKDSVQPMPAERSAERSSIERNMDQEAFANRKLNRTSLNSNHSSPGHSAPIHSGPSHAPQAAGERRERPERSGGDRSNGARKAPPPDQTNAENFYYQKQMQSHTPMVIVLRDGEEVHGVIEWYDRNCIKVNRDNGEPNLMIYKPAIKYMFKEGEK